MIAGHVQLSIVSGIMLILPLGSPTQSNYSTKLQCFPETVNVVAATAQKEISSSVETLQKT